MSSPASQGSSQMSQSQGKQPSGEDLQTLIIDTVVFIISQDHSKHPIKRQDIVKNCLKEYGKSFKMIMDEAKSIFKKVYGMDLVELELSTNNKQYMLINSLKMSNHVENLMLSEEAEAQQILLLLILSNIFMSGGVVREDQMWKFLTDLDILGSRKVHEYFGDVRKLVTVEFVRQMYIEYSRIPDSDPPKFQFRWGQRAEAEISHFELLKFVTKLYGSDDMKMWTTQYKDMVKAERKKGNNVNDSNDDSMEIDDDDDD